MNNCVNVVLGREEITLKIKEQSTKEEVEKCLEEKVPELKKIYQELFNSIEDGVCTDEGC